jgi:hypothetical protein
MALLDSVMNKKKDSSFVSGVLPVAFNIPTTGQLFHFAQTMVVNEEPQLTLYYVHQNLVRMMELCLWGIAFLIAYRRREDLRRGLGLIRRMIGDLRLTIDDLRLGNKG